MIDREVVGVQLWSTRHGIITMVAFFMLSVRLHSPYSNSNVAVYDAAERQRLALSSSTNIYSSSKRTHIQFDNEWNASVVCTSLHLRWVAFYL